MDVCNDQSLVALLSAHCYQEPRSTQLADRQYDTLGRNTSEIESDQRPPITTIEPSNGAEIQGQEIANKIKLRVSKKPGRPRLDAPHSAVLAPNRRKQVRRAQETFRLKKKAALESQKTRVAELEARIESVTDLFTEFHDVAIQSGLENTHPTLYDYLLRMRSHLSFKDGVTDPLSIHKPETEHLTPGKNTAQVCGSDSVLESSSTFGYQVPNESRGKLVYPSNGYTHTQNSPMRGHYSRPTVDGETILRSPLPQNIEWPLKGGATSTYSFHETTFSRRLHRYCLEHSYRLFVDTNSDPALIYRIFRLVPCIQNKNKMLPYFQKLVQGGLGDALEIATLPFYCIGRAGTHHRRNDEIGRPVYPLNSRLPKRLLGIVPTKTIRGRTLSVDYEKHLKTFGLDGEWFDCQDVEGFLQQRGIVLNQTSPVGEICTTTSHHSTHSSNYLPQSTQRATRTDILDADSGVGKNLSLDADDTQAGMKTRSTDPISSRSILDVDLFLTSLLDGLVMLGRAPGFKKSQVETAFMSSLRIQA